MYANNSRGGWRCRVKVRERQRGPNLDYYHRAGYLRERKRKLAGQRTQILERLAELKQEAVTLVVES